MLWASRFVGVLGLCSVVVACGSTNSDELFASSEPGKNFPGNGGFPSGVAGTGSVLGAGGRGAGGAGVAGVGSVGVIGNGGFVGAGGDLMSIGGDGGFAAGGVVGSGGVRASTGGATGSGGAAPTCTDSAKNGHETDVDCGGGTCASCAVGELCLAPTDCISQVCALGLGGNRCRAATCADRVLNENETDVDCGGTCPACANGSPCNVAGDCTSASCVNGACACKPVTCAALPVGTCGPSVADGCGTMLNCPCAAMCIDKRLDGHETALDCGGPDCKACGDGLTCTVARDCTSGVCRPASTGSVATCRTATCADMVKNGAETDLDCGGAACPKCAVGKICKVATDCASGACTGGVCACVPRTCAELGQLCGTFENGCSGKVVCTQCAGLCADGALDGNESDFDCGGPDCSPCPSGARCREANDCGSLSCSHSNGPGLTCD